MSRQHYLDLAAKGLAMPLAVDLFVHHLSSPERVEHDPEEMARVMVAAAQEMCTPLAVAPMDLRVERAALMAWLGAADPEDEKTHLHDPLSPAEFEKALATVRAAQPTPRMNVTIGALSRVAARKDLVPVGMCIGPFSLVTKMMADVITAFHLLGSDVEPDEDESVLLATQLLELSTEVVTSYARRQVEAGANAVIVCEPAANKAYISPNLMADGSHIFERVVLVPNRRVRDTIEQAGGDFILHDCGELTDEMIRHLGTLRPSMLSLGSSVDLAASARLVPGDVVLFGNIPSKHFPQDSTMPADKVEALCDELRAKMAALGRPFILGSECDVLHVPGRSEVILQKTRAISARSRLAKGGCCGSH